MTRLVHIRKPGPPRDRRIVARMRPITAETFCGAEVTAYDVTPRDAVRIDRMHQTLWAVCPLCKERQPR